MSTGSDDGGPVWSAVLEQFGRHASASVMACLALEHTLPAGWVDEVFEAHRQRQYSRELLFLTAVELTMLVSPGLRPSLHAAARQMPAPPVSLACLYDKVNHTEPGVLRALMRGSAERLGPVMAVVGHGAGSLPGWRLRVLDGNHPPASEKRLLPLRGFQGAALPGQSLVNYDPDSDLAEVPDPRRPQGQRYSMSHLLLFSILAVLTGATSYKDIIALIALQRERLNTFFGACFRRAPAVNTLRHLFMALGRRIMPEQSARMAVSGAYGAER